MIVDNLLLKINKYKILKILLKMIVNYLMLEIDKYISKCSIVFIMFFYNYLFKYLVCIFLYIIENNLTLTLLILILDQTALQLLPFCPSFIIFLSVL
jgi:hypothetical protein